MKTVPMIPRRPLLGLAVFLLASAAALRSEVRMPAIFGDHMVLQQGATLPVWGWAAPGEKVAVAFAGQSVEAVAGADGAWRADLKPASASARGQILTVAGKNTIAFQDVLVGDVWLVSGQSNIEFGIQTEIHAADEIPKANDPQLRLFFVPWNAVLQPSADIASVPASALNGKWQVCTPELMRAKWAWNGFSAVGYYFGREIRQSQGGPLGMIEVNKGGTPAQAWTSIAGLEKDPALAAYVEAHRKLVDHYDQAKSDFDRQNPDYLLALKAWNDEAAAAKAAGTPFAKPRPNPPADPVGGMGSPGNLFNGMVAPLIPYAIKGAIWYQGESNGNTLADAVEYGTLFPRMISDWRGRWGQGDFPFLYVQIANFNANGGKDPANGVWPWVRESQAKTLSLPATGMATAIDIGNPADIHPKDKLDVGQRLARVARRLVYGEDLVATGPVYEAMKVEGGAIRLGFASRGGGLVPGVPPWTPDGTPPPVPSTLKGFLVAGADRKFVPAAAVIEGDSVVVSSPDVAAPAAVRYDWSDNPDGNLYNREGLPAFPFRTDDWEPGTISLLTVVPTPGGGGWMGKFNGNVAKAKGKPVDLIFDGDSITDWFQTTGKDVWLKYYGGRRAVDFAIAGDRTENLLWRLDHGQLDGLDPKMVVLLIGTNNTVSASSDQIVEGVRACVEGYLKKCPHARLIVLDLFPRRTPRDPLRLKINGVNAKLDQIDFGDRVTKLNLGSLFLQGDGETVDEGLLPDRLHPSATGYEAWAAALESTIAKFVPSGA